MMYLYIGVTLLLIVALWVLFETWTPRYIRKLGRMYPNADCKTLEDWNQFLKEEQKRLKQLRQPKTRSSVYPEPQTFNEWQEFLRNERKKYHD